MVVVTEPSEKRFTDDEFTTLSAKQGVGSSHSKDKEYIIHAMVSPKIKLIISLVLIIHSFIHSFIHLIF